MITSDNENDDVDDDGSYDASFYSSIILIKIPILRNTS